MILDFTGSISSKSIFMYLLESDIFSLITSSLEAESTATRYSLSPTSTSIFSLHSSLLISTKLSVGVDEFSVSFDDEGCELILLIDDS